ncbi:MAG: hypothetical protein A3F10_01295 [Coxiella sp. RIFCSPHIGHO2_12_FULL_42_15]|nr:MAG: hypothetical protein A3F10_01295 [Coxiella sp. RIFCSPHIGHO2_12_FULL_42_15]
MNKIRRLSLALQFIFGILFLWLPIYTFVFWLSNGLPFGAHYPTNVFLYNGPALPYIWMLPLSVKVYGFLVNMIPIGLYMIVLSLLVRLFYLYAHYGEIISMRIVSLYKTIALFLLSVQIIRPLYGMLISYTLTSANPPGLRFVFFGISLQDVIMISIISTILLISWIIEEYHELNEEQGYIV